MRQLLAFAIVGIISSSATSAYAQCATCAAPAYSPVYSAPSYSTPTYSHSYAPAYSPMVSHGGYCPSGNCGLGRGIGMGHGMYGGGGCVGGNCGGGVHGVANKLWQMEKRKNYWLLATFGLR